MSVRHAVAMLAVAATSLADTRVEDLKSRIWASFSQVDAAQLVLPPGRRASGAALKRLYLTQRAPVVAEPWRIGGSDPSGQRGLDALALVFALGRRRLFAEGVRTDGALPWRRRRPGARAGGRLLG
jgi:hypothetical protein